MSGAIADRRLRQVPGKYNAVHTIEKRPAGGALPVHGDEQSIPAIVTPVPIVSAAMVTVIAGPDAENAIHGSDADETAAFEIGYWFAGYELI